VTGLELVMTMLFGFLIKHTVMDFFVQNRVPWMWKNKGRFGHPGGVAHSLTHTVGTFAVLWPFYGFFDAQLGHLFPWDRLFALTLAFEFIVHYFTDLCKMKICAWRGWKADTSPHFWDMLGIDQFIHLMTYWIIAYMWVGLATLPWG